MLSVLAKIPSRFLEVSINGAYLREIVEGQAFSVMASNFQPPPSLLSFISTRVPYLSREYSRVFRASVLEFSDNTPGNVARSPHKPQS